MGRDKAAYGAPHASHRMLEEALIAVVMPVVQGILLWGQQVAG